MIIALATSTLRVGWYMKIVYSSLLFSMDSLGHTITKCEGITTFWWFLNYLWISKDLVKLGLTRACEGCMKHFVSGNWWFVVPMVCRLTPGCAAQVLFMVFGRWFTIQALISSFIIQILKISNQMAKAQCKHLLGCDDAPLCQIWAHFEHVRSQNGPDVAQWGITSLLWFLSYNGVRTHNKMIFLNSFWSS